MTGLYIVLLAGLLLGQLGGIPLGNNAVMYVHDVLLVIFVWVAAVRSVRGNGVRRPRLLSPILGFIGVGALSLLFNAYRFDGQILFTSALYLVRWAAYASLYVVLAWGGVAPQVLLVGVYGSAVLFAVGGFVQLLLYPDLRNLSYLGWDPHYYRLFSSLLDPNFAGIVLVLGWFLGLYLWRKNRNWPYILGNVALFFGIYLTYSRGSYLALAAGMVSLIVYYRNWIWLLLVAGFFLAVFTIPTPGGKTLRMTRVDSTVARIGNWQSSLKLIATAPAFGHGFNTLRYVKKFPQDTGADNRSRTAGGIDSSVLFLLATTGIAGLASYAWLVRMTVSAKKRKESGHLELPLLTSIWTALFVHSMFSNSLFYAWVMIYLWIILAAVEVIYDT